MGEENAKIVTITGEYTFQVGEMFDSFEELEKRLELHCSESLVYYWRRDTRTVKGACTKTSRPIANKLKYYSLRYACVFGGEKKKSRSQGKRQNSKSLRKDCPSFIMLRASKNGQMLEVVAVCNEHNHDCTNDANESLPHIRKLPEEIQQEVMEMLLMLIDRKKIIEYVKRKTNKSITAKDLFNLKAKYKNVHLKLNRSKDEILQSMGFSPTAEDHCQNETTIDAENNDWITVCYDENVIEYDESTNHEDDSKVEIDVEVHSDNFIEYSENSEGDKTQFNADTDLPDYYLKEEVCLSGNALFVVDDDHEIVEVPQQNVGNTSIVKRHKLQKKNKRDLLLQWYIQKENRRLKSKLTNCRLCGTNSRFLNMQINVLQAEKQKLLEETDILKLTKQKLLNEVKLMQSHVNLDNQTLNPIKFI